MSCCGFATSTLRARSTAMFSAFGRSDAASSGRGRWCSCRPATAITTWRSCRVIRTRIAHRSGFTTTRSRSATPLSELAAAKADLEAKGVPVYATFDFRVSKALIVGDPDGNSVELYVDSHPEEWRSNPSVVASAAPLSL